MAQVVFLRGVNVGGARRFSAKGLATKLGLVNIGAAGTFVSNGSESAASLAKKIRAALPFETDVIVVPGEELAALAKTKPPKDADLFLTALAEDPAKKPKLPIAQPATGRWMVQAVALEGRLVVSHRRSKEAHGRFYPNELVEKAFGVAATTRGWNTLAAILKVIE